MSNNLILILTEGDPWGMSTGGQTTFTKHLLTAFGPRIAVSSHCDDRSIPIGKWIQRPFAESLIWFFSRGPLRKKMDSKPLLPARIKAYFIARKFMLKIRGKKIGNIIIDSPEMLFVIAKYQWDSVLYRFAGVNNFVSNSRYSRMRIFGKFIEKYHITVLNRVKPDVMIASADQKSIEEFLHRTGHKLDQSCFYQFPTRVDTSLFFPIETLVARKRLELPLDKKIFVATGRLNWIKGWDLLLEAFVIINRKYPESILIFVGDGEDRSGLFVKSKELGVNKNILITGFIPQSDVVLYMNAADVCLVGSYQEGWSLAMCEIIACGKAVVSTNVSGANYMINDGMNGYIVPSRNPLHYAEAVFSAINLDDVATHSLKISERYAVKNLAHELEVLWEPLRINPDSCA